ncbi:MAG: CRISPR-associated protein Cas6 [Sulfurihydrogenibium sp.]|nr:MAG: CRISPR-associated protein Cas6 [Sulfurihydrogenibium sp.]
MVNFEFVRLRFDYKILTPFSQPYFLGSSFRGIMGRKLKSTVCIKPFKSCQECELNQTCPYTVIFESELILNKPSKYVFIMPFEKRELKEGDTLSIDVTLLGSSSDYWEFLIASLSGEFSLGKGRILKSTNVYYYNPLSEVYKPVSSYVGKSNAVNFFDCKTGLNKIKVRLYPSSIKLLGKILTYRDFNKDVFVKAVLSRVSNVAKAYGFIDGKLQIDKEKFEIKNVDMQPSPMKRYSNRKGKAMIVPAFEGSFEIEGDLNEILPYLYIVENINIGKSTSFGLGRVKIL